jgi:hypothetical protein
MAKEAISVTLEAHNLLWLRAQVRAAARKRVSDVLDRLVTEARSGGRIESGAIRSVVGTVQLPADDPDLSQASEVVRRLFPGSRRTSPSILRWRRSTSLTASAPTKIRSMLSCVPPPAPSTCPW